MKQIVHRNLKDYLIPQDLYFHLSTFAFKWLFLLQKVAHCHITQPLQLIALLLLLKPQSLKTIPYTFHLHAVGEKFGHSRQCCNYLLIGHYFLQISRGVSIDGHGLGGAKSQITTSRQNWAMINYSTQYSTSISRYSLYNCNGHPCSKWTFNVPFYFKCP
jgi:hypothetical protein